MFAQLWHDLLNSDNAMTVLEPRLPSLEQHFSSLGPAFEPSGRLGIDPETSWELYAFSRVVDLLVSSLGPRAKPVVAMDEAGFSLLMTALSSRFVTASFHPFFHEIVMVTPAADDHQPPIVVEEFWPCCMRDALLLCRGGVHVEAGKHHIDKATAESSTLYFAHRRSWRSAHDPSHGWGSNSQWRTAFRRDYLIDDIAHFNSDIGTTQTPMEDGLTPSQRDELLMYRCWVRSPDSDDQWPYHHQAKLRLPT